MAGEIDVYDILVKKNCLCDVSNEKLFTKYLSSLEEIQLIDEERFPPNRDFRDSLLVKTSIIRIIDQLINGGKPSCFKILDAVTKYRTKISIFLTSLLISKDKHFKYASANALLAILQITSDLDILSTFCENSIDDNDKFDFLTKAQLSFSSKYHEKNIEGCQNMISKRNDPINHKKIVDIKLNELNKWLTSSRVMSIITNDSFLRFWSDIIRTIKRINFDLNIENLPQINHVESLLSVSCTREKVNFLNEIISIQKTSTNFQQKLSELLLSEIEKGWLAKIKLQIDYQNFFTGATMNRDIKISENFNSVYLREVVFLVLASLKTYSGDDPNILKAIRVSNIQKLLSKWIETSTNFHKIDWLVQLFIEQDDLLITAMLYCTEIYLNLKSFFQNPTSNSDLNPHFVFIYFLEAIGKDPEALVDFLSSIETKDILIFFVKYLKLVISEWEAFKNAHNSLNQSQDDSNLDTTMTTLIRLRLKLQRLEAKNLFPYKIKPLCKLIEECENLYEQ